MQKIWLGLLALLLLSAATTVLSASEAAPYKEVDAPIAFLLSHDAEVKAILAQAPQDTLAAEQRDLIKKRINSAFDFAELGRLALGTHWEACTAAERAHFISLFSGIVEEQNFDSFLRYYREGNIDYKSQELNGDRATVVASIPLKRESVEIVYNLHRVDDHWRIYDLSIDGASTAEGNRRRYARYIEKNSYDKLIQQLDKQLKRLQENGS
jgi:phospholipid transport system substrate-binding protein